MTKNIRLTSAPYLKTRYASIAVLILLMTAVLTTPEIVQSAKKTLNRVSRVSHTRTNKSEKIIISLKREVSYRARFLSHNPKQNLPYRLFFDLINTTLDPKLKNTAVPADSNINRIRTAQRNSTTARIVLDIKNKIYREDYKITQSNNPPAITIEFFNKKFESTAKKDAVKTAGAKTSAKKHQPEETIPLPDKYTKKTSDKDPNICIVVIDPGHGGKDPGAIGYQGIKEKDVCLPLGIALEKLINAKKGYKAILTRKSDNFLSLDSRGAIANKYNADIFISLHANSHEDTRLTGIETYYLSFASDEDARKVAARENFTTATEISDLEMIFFDLLQNNKINQSSILAGYIHNAMVENISNKYNKKIRNLGIKHAPMRVLINTEMPCILIEAAFISNPKEAKQLKSKSYQSTLAASIFNGIKNFKSAQKTAFNTTSP